MNKKKHRDAFDLQNMKRVWQSFYILIVIIYDYLLKYVAVTVQFL